MRAFSICILFLGLNSFARLPDAGLSQKEGSTVPPTMEQILAGNKCVGQMMAFFKLDELTAERRCHGKRSKLEVNDDLLESAEVDEMAQ